MRILMFLCLATSSLIFYSNAAGNTNQINTITANNPRPGDATVRNKRNLLDGGETEQNSNDPKYQKMAEKLVHDNLRIRKEDIQSIKVIRVTTQVVSGIVTRMEIRIILVSGISDQCNFKVWEQPWENVKHVTYNCLTLGKQTLLSANSGTPRPEQIRDPKNPKYEKLAKASIDYLFKTSEHEPFKKEDINKMYVTNVKAQIGSNIVNQIQFSVITVNNEHFNCTGIITETPWNPEKKDNVSEVTCLLGDVQSPTQVKLGFKSQLNWKMTVLDTNDPKYKRLAYRSAVKYLENIGRNIVIKKIKIMSLGMKTLQVTRQVIYYIHFNFTIVKPNTYKSGIFLCTSVYESTWRLHAIKCLDNEKYRNGATNWVNPLHDPGRAYKSMVENAFAKYLNTVDNVGAKDIFITFMTRAIRRESDYTIYFTVRPAHSADIICNSKVHGFPTISVKQVSCKKIIDNSPLSKKWSKTKMFVGREEQQDPNDPLYQQLAKDSFNYYLNSHGDFRGQVKSIEIDSVTRQVVAVTTIRIRFRVHSTKGSTLNCFSKIDRGYKLLEDFDVNCNTIPGGEEEQDPNDPKYKQLAKESFKYYLNSNGKFSVHAKSIEIDSVTTQVVAGRIIRIQFHVIPTRGRRLKCTSKICEGLGPHPKIDFDVSCDSMTGGEEEQDPNDPKYKQLAKESFKKYRKTHIGPLFTVKEIKVTRATTQVVAGIINRLDFYVITSTRVKYVCHSKIFEQTWKQIKKIDVNCNRVRARGDKKLTLKLSSVSNTKDSVSNAIKEYLRNEDSSGLEVDRCETTSVSTVNTRVAKQRITYYHVDVFTHTLSGDYAIFNCSVLTGAWFGKKPFSTNCFKRNYKLGRREWSDPTDIKYLSYAEKSLQLYLKNSSENVGPRDYTKYDVIVTFVTKGLAAGYVYDINFFARWVHDRDDDPGVLLCKSKLWEKLNEIYEIVHVKCTHVSWDRNNW